MKPGNFWGWAFGELWFPSPSQNSPLLGSQVPHKGSFTPGPRGPCTESAGTARTSRGGWIPPVQPTESQDNKTFFFFYFFSSLKGTLFIYIYWTIVDLQCFVSFWCMAAILFQIFSHYRLSKDNEYSSLCYTVGPCLSILNKVICIC